MRRSSALARAAAVAAVVSGGALIPFSATAAAANRHTTGYVTDPASMVNPFIGTANGGDTFPGADMPFGMIQWSPDTVPNRPEGGGYANHAGGGQRDEITGYGLTHMSGPGCPAEGDVPILPTTGVIPADPTDATTPLSHAGQTATPGYYAEKSGGIDTQLSTMTRAGIADFTFPAHSTSDNLLFKLSDSETADSNEYWKVLNAHEVEGYVTSGEFCGATNTYTVHFVMQFNQPIAHYGTWMNGSGATANQATLSASMTPAQQKAAQQQAKGTDTQGLAEKGLPGSANSANGQLRANPAGSTTTTTPATASGTTAQARRAASSPPVEGADGAYVTFDGSTSDMVQARVGISFVSTQDAKQNLNAEIPTSDTLATVHTASTNAWNQALSKIQVAGGTPTQQTVFYTSLYHSLLHPNINSDVNGDYMGFDGQVHHVAPGHAEYANYSGWDIYRSQQQLEAMLFPQTASDTVSSMLDDYNQTGMLPKWNENNGESYVMVGDPSDSIIADDYAFGARDFNTTQALNDMETEANVPGNIRPGLSYYEDDGYLPIDGDYSMCCNFYGPVSTQEEYNAADNSISELAGDLGDSSVQSTFATRANNWQNVYDPTSGFLEPKLMDGSFQSGFDPTSSNGFVEADAYVYRGELPFDLAGLIAAEGGDANYQNVLNGLFTSVTNMGATQAQMGNEPSFDLPWEYDYAGAPYKTQKVVSEVENKLYTDTAAGLAGNDDLGAMSSWYVWAALGMYPETPGSATVALGSPEFSSIAIHLGDGKTITESAPQASNANPYVQSMTVNGSAWNNAYLPASTFSDGANLDWSLGSTPNTTFASASSSAPPSNEAGLLPALGGVTIKGGDTKDVVQPGATGTLELDLQSMSQGSQTVNWTATTTSGSGIALNQTSGSTNLTSEESSVTPIGVTIPSSTTYGNYQVVFHLTTGTGTMLPNVVEDIAVAPVGSLTPYFNNVGITADSDTQPGNFDGDGYSFSQTALANAGVTLGGTVTNGGITYAFPSAAAGSPDNVEAGGQTVTLIPQTGESTIGFLGSASNGPTTGTVTINYTDGTSQTANITFGDWTLNGGSQSAPPSGDTVIAKTAYRNPSDPIATYMFATTVALQAGKTVQSVTLPSSVNEGDLHVFAIGSNAGPLTSSN